MRRSSNRSKFSLVYIRFCRKVRCSSTNHSRHNNIHHILDIHLMLSLDSYTNYSCENIEQLPSITTDRSDNGKRHQLCCALSSQQNRKLRKLRQQSLPGRHKLLEIKLTWIANVHRSRSTEWTINAVSTLCALCLHVYDVCIHFTARK